MNYSSEVKLEQNSVPQPEDETPATEGQSKAITDPDLVSAEQLRADTQSTPRQWKWLPWVHRVEVVVVVAVIVLVWCLLTLPIVFYYLPNVSRVSMHEYIEVYTMYIDINVYYTVRKELLS